MPQPASPISYSSTIPTLIAAALKLGRYEIQLPTAELAQKLRFQIYGYLRRLPEGDLTKLNFREYSIKLRNTTLIIEHRETNEEAQLVAAALLAAIGPEAYAAAAAEAQRQQLQAQATVDGHTTKSLNELKTELGLDATFDPTTFTL